MDLHVVGGESLTDFAQRINDSAGLTGVEAQVQGSNIAFQSTTLGSTGTVDVTDVVPDTVTSVTGVNSAQIANFELTSIPDEAEITLTGSIAISADNAELTYQGESGGVVTDTATFTLTGSVGSTQIAIVDGESLSSVRQRIIDSAMTTGVTAEVVGDDLVLQSVGEGSAESVNVTLDSVAQHLNVSGVNGSQVTSFQVTDAEPDSINTLNATVSHAATRGQLTYTGVLGTSTTSAEITLTGQLGSAVINISALQPLTSIRDSINAETANTGVSASVSGNTLQMTSTGYGSGAIVEIDVTSGTFNTSGGDGNGNAAGQDAQLDINGNAVTGNGNDVEYSDALGSYDFTVASGFSGAIDQITITSVSGTFAVTGGDGSGNAAGVDAEATVKRPVSGSIWERVSTGHRRRRILIFSAKRFHWRF